jgi:hypothetical protein
MVGMEGMRVPVWLTLGVALLVCVFGAYRIRLAFRTDAQDERARQRKGLYAMGRRTHFLVGLIYLLLGGALVATSFGWNPFAGVLGPRESSKDSPTTTRVAPGNGESVTFRPAPNAASSTGSAATTSTVPSAAPATTEPRASSATDPSKAAGSAEPTPTSK